jgi:hypothetical protein
MPTATATVTTLAFEPSVTIETVTPDKAVSYLAANKENRSLSEAAVRQYGRDLAAGRWSFSNDAICFASNGRLINGQHRLEAIVSAGVEMQCIVVRDLPPEAQHRMDGGRRRSAADALHLTGYAYTTLLGATAKQAILYSTGRMFRDSKEQRVSTAEIQEFVAEHDDLLGAVELASLNQKRIDARPTVVALAYWLFAQVDMEAASTFINELSSRVGQTEGSPILALDNRLRRLRDARVRTSQREQLFLFCKAWAYWRKGETVVSISLPSSASKFPVLK